MASTLRRRMLATGARQSLAPVLDVTRDPRWGRIEETYGEDPYLAAELGCAYVRGIQGERLSDGVIATGKHMVGHGLAEGGLNQAPAHLGPRELRDEQLFPFEAAVRGAGIASIMPAYCDVDGVPCHASHELLTGILRDEWGFDGIVASDYTGIQMLSTQHRLTPDPAVVAAASALRAGVDAELPGTVVYGEPLLRALADGLVDEALIDTTVERILRMKFRLGLFEHPFVEPPSPALLAALADDEARVARELAVRSLVLVENDGILPLRPDLASVAVIGPIADSARELLGDYAHLLHIETLLEMRHNGNAFGFPLTDEIVPADELAGRRTILDAIEARLPGADVQHARGTGIHDGTDAEIAEAVELARSSHVAIVVLGERSGLTDNSTTGEFRDRLDLGFMGRQQELLEAVVATGTPVVLVVVSGRPLAIEWAAGHCAAVLLAWVPGEAGPEAIVGRPRRRRESGRQAADLRAAPRRPGPGLVPPPPDRRSIEPEGRLRRRLDDAALAVRLRSVVHLVRAVEPAARPAAGRHRRRRDHGHRRRGQHRGSSWRRGGPALRARPGGDGRPSGAGAARVPPGRAGAGRAADRVVPAVRRAVRLRRRPTTGGWSSRASIRVFVGSSSDDLPLAAQFELVGPTVQLVERRRYLTETALG